MTGTIKLIRILLLVVIQHGGDNVSCKRSIRGTAFSILSYFKHWTSSSQMVYAVGVRVSAGVLFLGKTLYSHSDSLHPGVYV